MQLRSHTRSEDGQHRTTTTSSNSVATPSTPHFHRHRHNKCSVMVAPRESAIALSRSLVRLPGTGSDTSASATTCDLSRGSGLASTVSINPQLPAFLTHPGSSTTSPSSSPTQIEPTVDKLCSQQRAQVRKSGIRLTTSQPYNLDSKKFLWQVTSNSTSTLNPASNLNSASPMAPPSDNSSSSMTPNTNSSTPTIAPTTIPFPAMPPTPPARTVDLPNDLLANRQGRLVYMSVPQAVRHASQILHVNTHGGPVLFMPVVREGMKLRTVGSTQAMNIVQATANEQVNNEGGVGQQGSGMTLTTLEQLMKQQNNLNQENASLQQQIAKFRQLFQDPERLVAVARQLGLKINSN